MIEQLTPPELGLRLPAPKISPEEVQRTVEILQAGGNWMTAQDIAHCVTDGTPAARKTFERRIRLIASVAMPKIVSYPGSPGFKLWDFCTVEEIDRAIAAFEHQGAEMLKRSIAYRQAYHKRFRAMPHIPENARHTKPI
jgi:hypothetical protein